ncbi:MAG TPA: hypothetical protein VGP72_05245 [Planctomycetota bacterium]|jgi:replication-associated recombination protein RarA
MQLHEKYRPKSLAGVAGHSGIVHRLQALLDSPTWTGDAIWLQGPSGMGKTTLANIIAAAKCDPRDIHHLAGADCTIEAVDEIKAHTQLSTWGTGWKAFCIDEANAMSSKSVQAWKTLLEPLKPRRLYIFTSARMIDSLFETGAENDQLASRCKVFTLMPNLEAITSHVCDTLCNSGELGEKRWFDQVSRQDILALVTKHKGNLRSIWQEIELQAQDATEDTPDADVPEDVGDIIAQARALLAQMATA